MEQARIDLAGVEMALEQSSKKQQYKLSILPEPINSIYNDFAAAQGAGQSLAITSGRIKSNRKSLDERFGESYTDNYLFSGSEEWKDITSYKSLQTRQFKIQRWERCVQ